MNEILDANTISIFLIVILCLLSLFFVIGLILFFLNKKTQNFFKKFFLFFYQKKNIEYLEMKNFARQLAGVLIRLSSDVVGGLIVVERKDSLEDYVKLGYSINAKFSSEFAVNIFYNKASPLHDGAIIVRGSQIISVSSYFPVTKKYLEAVYGARHRAAIGVSEISDAVAFVVSETTGKISFSQYGKIQSLSSNMEKLTIQIYELLMHKQISDKNKDALIIHDALEEK